MLQPDASVRKSARRPCDDAMGSLLKDTAYLASQQKALFTQLYHHIVSLVTVINDSTSCLEDQPTVDTTINHSTIEDDVNTFTVEQRSENDNKRRYVRRVKPNQGSRDAGCLYRNTEDIKAERSSFMGSRKPLKTVLNKLANDVKSLDAQKKGMKSWRELANGYDKLGRSLFKYTFTQELEVLSHMDINDKLVLRMVGMHLLHYGLVDVYDILKAEIIERWGKEDPALVPDTVCSAYHILHNLLSKFDNNDLDGLIDWVKKNIDASHLHVERFNTMLLNIQRIKLLSDYYDYNEDGKLELKELDITPEHICKVNKCSLSGVWTLHNDEIGRLMTQVLLGQNLPTPSAFLELKLETENMFIKLFCENGVLIRKEKKPSYSKNGTSGMNTQFHARQDDQEMQSNKHDNSDMLYSSDDEFDPEQLLFRKPPGDIPKKSPFRSWLTCLKKYNHKENEPHYEEEIETESKVLKRGWLSAMERGTPSPHRYPRIPFSRLRSPTLGKDSQINSAKNIIGGKLTNTNCLYTSETIRAMHNDIETTCRQLLPTRSTLINAVNITPSDEDSTGTPDTAMERGYAEGGPRGVAALLLEAAEASGARHLNISNMARLSPSLDFHFGQRTPSGSQEQDAGAAETPRGSHPTVSLTLFTGSQAIREALLSSQIIGEEANPRILATESGRIRITFPTRTEQTEAVSSQGRRNIGGAVRLHPYSTENVHAELRQTPAEQTTSAGSEHEEGSLSTEVANINGILRMIMRGITGQALDEGDPLLQVSAGFATPIPNMALMTGNEEREEGETGEEHVTSKAYKGSFTQGYELKCEGDFMRVFLPYESPISVLVCAGYIIHPRLVEIADIPTVNEDVSTKIGDWMRSCKQLPIESDMGPAFCFHSYLTCPISKDQTSSQNLPVMLPCGHVICSLCVAKFGSGGRKYQFKCPMCPQMVSSGELKELYLDWNYCGLDDPI